MTRVHSWGLTTAAAVVLACSGTTASSPTGPGGNNNPGGNQNPSNNTLNVQVSGGSFQPPADTVALNSTVTWTFNEGPHNVTFQDGPASSNQSSGTYERTFSTAGSYPYRCTLHSSNFASGMTGTVVVK